MAIVTDAGEIADAANVAPLEHGIVTFPRMTTYAAADISDEAAIVAETDRIAVAAADAPDWQEMTTDAVLYRVAEAVASDVLEPAAEAVTTI